MGSYSIQSWALSTVFWVLLPPLPPVVDLRRLTCSMTSLYAQYLCHFISGLCPQAEHCDFAFYSSLRGFSLGFIHLCLLM